MKPAPHEGRTTPRGFSPLASLGRFLFRAVTGRIGHMPQYLHRPASFPGGAAFTVFRTIRMSGAPLSGAAVFTVRFTPRNMTLMANRVFSLVPIPFFTGLPGFRAKCWMEDRVTGTCSGIYQWDSAEAARAYARSFAIRFMMKRSVPGSLSWQVHPGTTLERFMEAACRRGGTGPAAREST
ncbi:MAG: hypothetical protein JXA20_15895 [Spirochaetes bacterium]|nr:hypothetical protein [Spirochaetota bacterium]